MRPVIQLVLVVVAAVSSFLMSSPVSAATVEAAAQLSFSANATQRFSNVGPERARFSGPTVNNFETGANSSQGSWASGQVTLGDFGHIEFVSQPVGDRHHNYTIAAIPVPAGPSLIGLSATFHGTDGLGNPVNPFTVSLPDSVGSFTRVQVFAPIPPDNGSSALSPLAAKHFATTDLLSAGRDLQARLTEYDVDYKLPNSWFNLIVSDLAGPELATQGLVKVVGLAAPIGIFLHNAILKKGQEGLNQELLDNLNEASERWRDAQRITEELALKAFIPQQVLVTGQSDGIGGSVITIGGPNQQYVNDFRFVDSVRTTGTSTFSGGGVSVSGQIDTLNVRNANGTVVAATSTLSLPQGQLSRFGRATGPSVDVKKTITVTNPDGTTSEQEIVAL